jgi:hypothetical protein
MKTVWIRVETDSVHSVHETAPGVTKRIRRVFEMVNPTLKIA